MKQDRPVAKGDGVARVGDEIAAQAALTVFVGDAGR